MTVSSAKMVNTRYECLHASNHCDKYYSIPDISAKFPKRDVVSITNAISKIVVGFSGTSKKIGEGNQYVNSMVQDYPNRLIQFYWVMLSQTNPLENKDLYD